MEVRSLYDIYLLIVRLLTGILGFFGLRKRGSPWGTVYDAVTKRPLDPAIVTAYRVDSPASSLQLPASNVQPLASSYEAITDLDGRYAFLLPDGEYALDAHKSDYSFPSKLMSGHVVDEIYNNLYFGGNVEARSGEIIARDIPLDPVRFNWNEFIKDRKRLFRIYERRQRVFNFIFGLLYALGFFISAASAAIIPSRTNISLLVVYAIIFIVSRYTHRRHHAVSIIDERIGEPVSFAIVRVFLAKINKEVKHVVADASGRFYLLVSPGDYYITVQSRSMDGSYQTIFTSETMHLPKGILRAKQISITAKGVKMK